MSLYYDRAGNPLSLDEWAASFGRHADKRVAEDVIDAEGCPRSGSASTTATPVARR